MEKINNKIHAYVIVPARQLLELSLQVHDLRRGEQAFKNAVLHAPAKTFQRFHHFSAAAVRDDVVTDDQKLLGSHDINAR